MPVQLSELRARIDACPHEHRGFGHRCGAEPDDPCAEVWTCDDCGAWDEELEPHCVTINLSGLCVYWTEDDGTTHLRNWDGEYVFRRRKAGE